MLLLIKKLSIYLFISIGLFSISTISASGIPETIEFEGSTLMLNGKGTRVVFFMKVYEGSLYLETKSSDADQIINDSYPMAIRIDVTSEIVTADAMKKALSDGLEKSTNNNTVSILDEIEQLSSSFNSAVTSGDFYEFIYIPEIGTHVLKNNEFVELIPGLEFKKAFFGIFLSKSPIQKNLKKAMLGD
ncbi:MAG: chalcone isomerase family protein [Candidatus Pseudothioglobus sp.]|tara:strand:- start:292 stop:855 length:564 start_codon:yes stop_codon:yes gene_type:complete